MQKEDSGCGGSGASRQPSENDSNSFKKKGVQMDRLFTLPDVQLRILMQAFKKWYQDNEKERKYAEDQKRIAEEIRTTLLDNDYISKSSDGQLAQRIFDYSRKLEGPAFIRLGMPRITEKLEDIKRNLFYLIESSDDPSKDPFTAAGRILEGDYRIPIFAKAFWSPVLQSCYPNLLPNWNNKSERFLKKFGVNLSGSKLSVEQKYRLLSKAFLELKQVDPSEDFYTINHLMHFGTETEEGIKLIEKITNGTKMNYWQIAPGENARLWKDFRKDSIAAVGWNNIEVNLDGKSKEELRELYSEKYPGETEHKEKVNATQLANFVSLKPGDKIVVNKGKSQLLAIGEVKSNYKFRPERPEYRHTVDVNYYKVSDQEIPIPLSLKGKFGKTIIPLSAEEFKTLEDLFSNGGEPEPNAEYLLAQCTEETGFSEEILKRWVSAIERKGQAIIYGPPGTGKTFIAEKIARHLIGGMSGFFDVVQFHPAYAYEDFIQGIRPQSRDDGTLDYPVVPGRFLNFCDKAAGREGICVLIVDEINRANLAAVFGELMYLLEYRDREIPLASGGRFRIPSNVRIIGTMNTADRSIALVDHALRRRFSFLSLYPKYDVLRKYHKENGFDVEPLIKVLEKLNRQIDDRNYEVGITFFLMKDLAEQIEGIWRMEIEPYLEEYFFDQQNKADEFRWEKLGKEIVP